MCFNDGVLVVDADWTQNQKRNAYVYSDFWKRSDLAIKEDKLTHEDELLDGWRTHFKKGILLDAGCGSGRHLRHWVKSDVQVDAFVMVDISDSIFQCRSYYQELDCQKPAIFIKCSISDLPIKSRALDHTWTSGVIGLLEQQQLAVRELCRITQNTFFLGVLTEKNISGKIYIFANVFKPLLNKIKSMSLLFLFAGVIAKLALLALKCCYHLKISLFSIRREKLKAIVNDPLAASRLQHSLYDPIIIPKIIKHPDSDYIDWAKSCQFFLYKHQTEIICDYFHFKKAS